MNTESYYVFRVKNTDLFVQWAHDDDPDTAVSLIRKDLITNDLVDFVNFNTTNPRDNSPVDPVVVADRLKFIQDLLPGLPIEVVKMTFSTVINVEEINQTKPVKRKKK